MLVRSRIIGVPLRCWSDTQRCRVVPWHAPNNGTYGDRAKPPVVKPPDGFAANPQMTTRRFPPPWSVEDIGAAFVVKDSANHASEECVQSVLLTRRSVRTRYFGSFFSN